MPHSYTKIWIHAIWSTKNRAHLILPSFERKLYQFLSDQLKDYGCPVSIINGMPDHVHCLFLLNAQKSIADTIKQIKGSSSFYINQNECCEQKFVWQRGYAAYSVSESSVEKVYQYIKNQKQHHKTQSSQQEFEEYLRIYGLE